MSGRIPERLQPWIDARTRHRLSHAHVQMARELGLNPNRLGKIDNHRQEPWKLPLPEFIERLYFKRFTRAARDFTDRRPEFSLEAGMAALRWLIEGYGYEITGADVWSAYTNTMKAAEKAGCVAEARDRIRRLVASAPYANRFVIGILGRELGL